MLWRMSFWAMGRRFVNGEELTLADLHSMWMIKWALQTLGVDKEPGMGKEDFPRVWRWIEGLKKHDEAGDAPQVSKEEAMKTLLSGQHAQKDIGVDGTDPTGLKEGQQVTVGTSDE